MKTKPKTKPIVPRTEKKELRRLNGKSRYLLTSRELKTLEKAERAADLQFAGMFSAASMMKIAKEEEAAHGADFWQKAGAINSQADFDENRALASSCLAYDAMERIEGHVIIVSPDQLRLMRLAFEAGAAYSEARAYTGKLYGGRKPLNRAASVAFALSRWESDNPRSASRPDGNDLAKYSPELRGLSGKTIQNLSRKQ